ncbi:hypothetical protein FRC14_000494 [Serendipita sp. 396]|nr:hypothetical protein FRC14_000494 [Serendipita sp. 396]KAG8779430.1 hypothetical protein FRC15_010176 [Serendipita sp. 397]KAG8850481.1 hypothetical protein FRB91_009022 [Serendipita sp. 411]KAG8851105.1 hypothetical protein FRC20_001862 [Serendipita sp. 405]KAG9055358.1 hypothetical protein FS842_002423 [Serendipita sp. 407]
MIARQSVRTCKRQWKRTYASISPPRFGQPDPVSHPHLFGSPDELTPGITRDEFHQRRKKLMDSLPDGSTVVLRAGSVKYMSGNIFYRFRQASDFWYLTGFEEPDSVVVLEKKQSPKGYHMTFFSSPRDAHKELWEGPITGQEGAVKHFGADDALEIGSLTRQLPNLISASSHVYADIHNASSLSAAQSSRKSLMGLLDPVFTHRPIHTVSNTPSERLSFEVDSILLRLAERKRKNLGKEVATLRRVKSPAERRLMKGAAKRSARAHTLTMQYAQPGMSEAELESWFQHKCAQSCDVGDGLNGGCQRLAYVPVVASGRNALTIHHTSNDQQIREGELVLIDAGGEWNGYASDITRTFPVSGTFTAAQKVLYQAVLNVQKKCISILCTGSPHPTSVSTPLNGGEAAKMTLPALHRMSTKFLADELTSLGFKLDPYGREVEERLYPHLVGHGVGIDLHESSGMRNDELVEGQVVTVEPGVYVPADKRYPEEFHNIGIRIEDEVLIEKDHGVVLSVDAPKEIEDIEAVCQGKIQLR